MPVLNTFLKNNEMKVKGKIFIFLVGGIAVIFLAFAVPTTLIDFFLPGSQPEESGSLDGPSKCSSCHGGFDKATEPFFNWTGSMMAQSARDPLYMACLAISNQDVPFSGDLCIRCHAPEGWLGGRSTPTDGSALKDSDKEGVHCGFCHRMLRPAEPGINMYPGDIFYTVNTYPADQTYLNSIDSIPESIGNGSYVVDSDVTRRGPFTDPGAKHDFYYSPFHSESAFCGTCHDVSNPAFSSNMDGTYSANDFNKAAPSFNTYDLFPVERTYSEWIKSEYNSPAGVYAPQFGGNKEYVSTCQDCHMRDLSGVACNQPSGVYREDLPYHDLTGGNTFIPKLVKLLFTSVNSEALDSGIIRARYMLQKAATLDLSVNQSGNNPVATVRVTNETGHKLPSGYPEGRRIWINLVAKDGSGTVIYESGHYDVATATLTEDNDAKIYHIKPGMDATIAGLNGYDEGPSFHFVLNNKIFFDNRIPPRGFTNSDFDAIQSPPVGYTYNDGQYWDETNYSLPVTTSTVEVYLFYQTVSNDYVEFLRDENHTNGAGQDLYDLWAANGKSAPELMAYRSTQLVPTSTGKVYPESLQVYPNPSAGIITFKFSENLEEGGINISIFNSLGSPVYTKTHRSISQNQVNIDMSGHPGGLYIYRVSDQKGKVIYSGTLVIR